MAQQAASEPQDTLTELGAMDLASAVKVTPQQDLTSATEMDTTVDTQAFGATPASEYSDMAMATARQSEEDTDTAKGSPQDIAFMAMATTLALAPLVLAMDPVCLVSE